MCEHACVCLSVCVCEHVCIRGGVCACTHARARTYELTHNIELEPLNLGRSTHTYFPSLPPPTFSRACANAEKYGWFARLVCVTVCVYVWVRVCVPACVFVCSSVGVGVRACV